ncbi:MAG TPA: hypothetical protein VGJ81_09970 [Thermoanaerobaculia bacterium]|jgi:hypothetical protein
MQLLQLQIEIAIRRVGNVSERFQSAIKEGIERRWVGEISFYGLDSDSKCRAQLDLLIDWKTHDLEIANGRATVTIDGRWRDSTAIEVDAAVDLFNRYVHEMSLHSVCRVKYSSGVDHDLVNRTLGLVDAEPLRWAEGGNVDRSFKVPELKELRVGLRLLDR